MSLTGLLIVIPGICYAAACLLYAWRREWAYVLVYSGYAWANTGLWLLDLKLKGGG